MKQIETLIGGLFFFAVFYHADNFYHPKWVSHFEQIKTSYRDIEILSEDKTNWYPKVDFDSLVDCQQFLHFMYSNVNEEYKSPRLATMLLPISELVEIRGVMYCHSGCRRNLWEMFSPGYGEEKVGNFICPIEDAEIVGRVFAK